MVTGMGQSCDSLKERSKKADDKKFLFGGYAQIDFNQPVVNGEFNNGKLDVHRMVLLMGYRFNDKISFMSEVEIEHANEIYLEQAYLNYRFKSWLQFRAGLMLIPMGIINENHCLAAGPVSAIIPNFIGLGNRFGAKLAVGGGAD